MFSKLTKKQNSSKYLLGTRRGTTYVTRPDGVTAMSIKLFNSEGEEDYVGSEAGSLERKRGFQGYF